ncbi:MAG: hypothetical protein ACRD12_10490 [Acidimicrobiales bacterium]
MGLVEALRRAPEIELVGALDHVTACAWSHQWQAVDAVIVDAADERRAGDQFPGVSVVRRIREVAAGERPLVIVVTGHSFHDGLRHRMAEAHADLFFHRSELDSTETLVDVLLHPEHWRRGVPRVDDADLRQSLGIAPHTDIEALVGYIEVHGLASALDPDGPPRSEPRSRRWLHHRSSLAREARVEPMNMTTGNRPLETRAPSIRQISRIWAWAARIGRPPR